MDNKLNNMINEFFKNNNVENIDEANEKIQEFIKMYNNGEIKYENTPLDDAYDLLEKAENAKSKTQAIKYAKEAYDMCPDCFDAILLQVNLEDDPIKSLKLLNEGLEIEEERLKTEGYFTKESIGHFYGIFETRPYIRGLYNKAELLIIHGKMKKAIGICKEILRLNTNDNLGARYLLMALYAYFEEENEMLKLYKKYPEEHLEMLFPLFALYYKLENDKKAKEYLNRINRANPHFLKFFKGNLKPNKDLQEGAYIKGDASEVCMYLQEYYFLLTSVPTINYYVLENSKNKK